MMIALFTIKDRGYYYGNKIDYLTGYRMITRMQSF